MDALAGYGSADSSLSSNDNVDNSKAQPKLVGLADYSDDEDESSNEEKPNVTVGSTDEPNGDTATNHHHHHRKRQRALDDILPPPPLSDTSVIHWMKDYSDTYRTAVESETSPELSKKLLALQQGNGVSWAHHLKSQHEFHNPHFFQAVVEHFGIQELLSSNISVLESSTFHPYEYELPAAEEQARIRQQEQQQQQTTIASQCTQQKLEGAMHMSNQR